MTKLFVPFIAAITWHVVLVTCYQPENGGQHPNIDIATVVKKILERLDRIEGKIDTVENAVKVKISTVESAVKKKISTVESAVKVVETTVRSNMNILMRIGTHVEKQETKLDQVVKKIAQEDGKIQMNAKAVETIGEHNKKLSKMLKDNLQNISSNIAEVKGVLTDVLPGKMEGKPATSCSWLKEHSYCARNGYYWLNNAGGATLQYCKMDSDAPVHQGKSCQDLKDRYPDLESGIYTITVGGKSFEVHCDMDTDGGGWLMVGNVIAKNKREFIQFEDFTQLKRVTTGRFVLSMKAINSLYDAQPFHQVRFDCTKKYHRRRVNLATVGDAVIEWLVRGHGPSVGPVSCGTYITLDNDTSVIGGDCTQWSDIFGDAKWNKQDIYLKPMQAYNKSLLYYTSLFYDGNDQMYCDDDKDHPNFDHVGSWSYYIR